MKVVLVKGVSYFFKGKRQNVDLNLNTKVSNVVVLEEMIRKEQLRTENFRIQRKVHYGLI